MSNAVIYKVEKNGVEPFYLVSNETKGIERIINILNSESSWKATKIKRNKKDIDEIKKIIEEYRKIK